MKKVLFLTLLITFTASGFSQKFNDLINLERYSKSNEELIMQQKYPKVVLIGNSITEGWYESDDTFFNENDLCGRGISGQTSSQMLSRFRQDVVELQPRVVVINAGTNDIAENTGAYDKAFTMGNIKSMCDIARANGIRVILTSVLPASQFGWNFGITDVAQKVDELNAEIRNYAKSKGFPYVDYNTQLRNEVGGLDKSYSGDGVHPNYSAYKIMESELLPVIKRELKNTK